MANCDFGGPKFVASKTPVYRLDSTLQRKIVLYVVNKISEAVVESFVVLLMETLLIQKW